jgi:hypothetical protein
MLALAIISQRKEHHVEHFSINGTKINVIIVLKGRSEQGDND